MDTDIDQMTGENHFKLPTRYSEITFNGDTGEFFYRSKDAEKDEATGKYPKESLGKELSVVFLKIRRVLQSKYKPKTPSLRTNEHNVKGDAVWLFRGTERLGRYKADRELSLQNQLYTNQIIYSYFPAKKEVVRLIIRGASLGSDKTAKGVLKFYDYIQSFKGDDRLRSFLTVMAPVGEEGPKGVYYAVNFTRGAELDAAKKEKVAGLIKEIHAALTASDERQNVAAAPVEEPSELQQEEAPEEEKTGFAYPEEEINPDDIPF